MSERRATIAEVAAGCNARWRASECRAAGDSYWAERDEQQPARRRTRAIPCVATSGGARQNLHWLSSHRIEYLSLDGPYVTGDHFALFADMLMVHVGQRMPHSQTVVFAVRDGKIIEERYFKE